MKKFHTAVLFAKWDYAFTKEVPTKQDLYLRVVELLH